MIARGRVLNALVAGLAISALGSPAAALSGHPMPRAGTPANPSPRLVTDLLPLPKPEKPVVLAVPGITADRKRVSYTPGPVEDHDEVTIAVDGSGSPARVELVQRLTITGTGDYGIYERGPARQAEALDGSSPPVAKLGTVVWQGFSPGRRTLAAKLRLDPGIESLRLPLGISLDYVDSTGRPGAIGPGGAIPGAGVVTITLADQTAQDRVQIATGAADAVSLGAVADQLLAAAASPGSEPPVAGRGLPTSLSAEGVTPRAIPVSAALAVSGRITVLGSGVTVTGPATTPITHGARVRGTLNGGTVAFQVRVDAAATLQLDLEVLPTVDRRALTPPGGFESWSAWAASTPSLRSRGAATDQVVAAAAAAVRAADFYPYLQTDLVGRASGSFHYRLDTPAAVAKARAPLEPKPGAIALVLLATSLVFANGAALRKLL